MLKLPESFDAFVFDMDGILIDTEILYKKAMHQAAGELGYEFNDELHNSQVGVPLDDGNKLILAHFGDQFPVVDYNARTSVLVREMFEATVPLKPGAAELLEALAERGIPMAVATSTESPTAETRLKQAGFFDRFQHVITRTQCENGKPHPEPFLRAAEALGVDPRRCMAAEDSHNGVRSAAGAGMNVIMVPDLLVATEEMHKLAYAVVDSLSDVVKALAPV